MSSVLSMRSFRSLPCLLLFAAISFASSLSDHPALGSFDLSGASLPGEIFLVRTRGSLPAVDGITVHGSHDGLFVVSGEEDTVMGLVELGCGVFPLEMAEVPDSAPLRTWTLLTEPDPDVAAMVAQVNWDDISSHIQWLVDFQTRYTMAVNHTVVAGELAAVFSSYGLDPLLRSYQYGGTTRWNVEATQTGTVFPDSFIVVCGHFDSVSEDPYNLAPGADDNGTGTATVLTAAEILTQYDFQYSIRYICFSGEEQGLKGSQAYAQWASANDIGIVGVLNFDMLGYWEPGVEDDLEIETNQASQWFAQAVLNAADLYTDTPYELHVDDGAWWGDHASFWGAGFAAVNHEEAWDWGDPDFNPYYHSTGDLLMYVGEDFMVNNIRLCIAALATLAVPDTGSSGVTTDQESISGFSMFARPNPFRGQVEFEVTGPLQTQTARISVYDIMGRCVDAVDVNLFEGHGTAIWATTSGVLPQEGTGVYFAVIEDAPSSPVTRLVQLQE